MQFALSNRFQISCAVLPNTSIDPDLSYPKSLIDESQSRGNKRSECGIVKPDKVPFFHSVATALAPQKMPRCQSAFIRKAFESDTDA